MSETLIGLSVLIAVVSGVLYVREILQGRAKPHRTTRFVLLFISALSTFSLIAQGNQVAVWLAGIFMIRSLVLFLLSIKRGMGGWSQLDILCLVIAILGVIVWRLSNDPIIALYASVLADFTGFFPTIVKTYKHPHTEALNFFSLEVVAALLTLLAIKTWTLQEYLFPLYIFVLCSVMIVLIVRPKFMKVAKII